MPHATPLSSLPPRYQAQALPQLGRVVYSPVLPQAPATGAMLRQSNRGINKTEALFLEYLREQFPGAWIEREPVALKIGNGVRYNPDFLVHLPETFREHRTQLVAYEVKGYMRDDAAVKLKVAATRFPWITFFLVWREKRAGAWKQQQIAP